MNKDKKIARFLEDVPIFFSMNCCEVMFRQHEQGDDYRLAFTKAVFNMYKNTILDSRNDFTEDDFINISDDSLHFILRKIIEQDRNIKLEYDKEQIEDVYERFYKATESLIKQSVNAMSESIRKMGNSFEAMSKPLLSSLGKVNDSIANTSSEFARLSSSVADISRLEIAPSASYLSNIQSPMFSIQEIFSPLKKMADNIQIVNNDLAQKLQTSFVQMAKSIQTLMESINFSLLRYDKELSEQRETLINYGWFYSGELPDELINDIHKKREELNVDDVDKMIVEYFRLDRCKELKNIVNKWRDLTYFNCRNIIFHEALVNHSRRYFNSSVTLLTIHTEGVITDFVRTSLENPRFKVGKAIDDIKRELDENGDVSFHEYEVFNDVIRRIEEAFNENFNHSNPNATSNKSRHKIAHGHVYEKENEVNSLKQFLYLNEIYHLFLLLNKSVD